MLSPVPVVTEALGASSASGGDGIQLAGTGGGLRMGRAAHRTGGRAGGPLSSWGKQERRKSGARHPCRTGLLRGIPSPGTGTTRVLWQPPSHVFGGQPQRVTLGTVSQIPCPAGHPLRFPLGASAP